MSFFFPQQRLSNTVMDYGSLLGFMVSHRWTLVTRFCRVLSDAIEIFALEIRKAQENSFSDYDVLLCPVEEHLCIPKYAPTRGGLQNRIGDQRDLVHTPAPPVQLTKAGVCSLASFPPTGKETRKPTSTYMELFMWHICKGTWHIRNSNVNYSFL